MNKSHGPLGLHAIIVLGVLWLSLFLSHVFAQVSIPTGLTNAVQYIMQTVWTSDGSNQGDVNVQISTWWIYIRTWLLTDGMSRNNKALWINSDGQVVYVEVVGWDWQPVPGPAGVGIESTVDNQDGTFTINYTDGTSFTTINFTGPQGQTWSQWPTGPAGPQGDIWPQWPTGPAGQDWADGTSITINGSFTDVSELPPIGNIGDGYLIDGDLYVRDAINDNRQNVWSIQGPAWPTGPQGETWPQGPAWPTGPQGETWPQGEMGPNYPIMRGSTTLSTSPISLTFTGAGVIWTENNNNVIINIPGGEWWTWIPQTLSIDGQQLSISDGNTVTLPWWQAWNITGNENTNEWMHFIGTIDSQPLSFRTDNLLAWQLSPNGSVWRGRINTIMNNSLNSTIAWWINNQIRNNNTNQSTIGWGAQNQIQSEGSASTIAWWFSNIISATVASIWWWSNNIIGSNGGTSTIWWGAMNNINGVRAVIAWWFENIVNGEWANIAGWVQNQIQHNYSNIAWWFWQTVNSPYSNIAWWQSNTIASTASHSSVGWWLTNTVWGVQWFIGWWVNNNIAWWISASTIAGGSWNTTESNFTAILWWRNNIVNGVGATVVWWTNNSLGLSPWATIVWWLDHGITSSTQAFIGWWNNNNITASTRASILWWAWNNINGASSSSILWWSQNSIAGSYAVVVGWQENQANGSHSLAAWRRARALHNNTFVWNGQSDPTIFSSTQPGQFLINSYGGVGINTNSPQNTLHINGSTYTQWSVRRSVELRTCQDTPSNYTMSPQDHIVIYVCGNENVTYTLPANPQVWQEIIVVKRSPSSTLTLVGNGNDSIEWAQNMQLVSGNIDRVTLIYVWWLFWRTRIQ